MVYFSTFQAKKKEKMELHLHERKSQDILGVAKVGLEKRIR